MNLCIDDVVHVLIFHAYLHDSQMSVFDAVQKAILVLKAEACDTVEFNLHTLKQQES